MQVIPNKFNAWNPINHGYPGWKLIATAQDGASLRNDQGLQVIVSGEFHDSKAWIHASLSRRSKMPTYEDLAMVKKVFVGDDKRAFMVLPDAAHHVNLHPFCLHLYCCIDGDGLPEFSAVVNGVRTI